MMGRKDLFIALALLLLGTAAVYRYSEWTHLQYWDFARDIWFDADSDRIYFIEAVDAHEYDRTLLHPLYPYLTRPIIRPLHKAVGLKRDNAVRWYHAGVGGLWLGCFFLVLRRVGCRRFDALIFSGVAATSAAAMFWLPTIEGFVLGSLSMFPAYWLAASPSPLRPLSLFFATVAGWGVTVTNGMVSIFVAIQEKTWRHWVGPVAAGLGVVALAAVAHGVVFPGANVMLSKPGGEAAWIFSPESNGPWAITRSFFFHSMSAPEFRFLENWQHPAWPFLTFQFSGLFSGNVWTKLTTPIWTLLLIIGFATLRRSAPPRLRLTLIATILCQWLLHLLYGKETFLYSIQYLPALLLVVALATQTRWRVPVLALAIMLMLGNVAVNGPAYRWARTYTQRAPILKTHANSLKRIWVHEPKTNDPTWEYRFWRDLNF